MNDTKNSLDEMYEIIDKCYQRLSDQDIYDSAEEISKDLHNAGYIKPKVIYRPQRGSLSEAMSEAKEFSSVKEMFEYITCEHNGYFSISDLYISYFGYDERIGWDTFLVTTRKYGRLYTTPQAIGFCTING